RAADVPAAAGDDRDATRETPVHDVGHDIEAHALFAAASPLPLAAGPVLPSFSRHSRFTFARRLKHASPSGRPTFATEQFAHPSRCFIATCSCRSCLNIGPVQISRKLCVLKSPNVENSNHDPHGNTVPSGLTWM